MGPSDSRHVQKKTVSILLSIDGLVTFRVEGFKSSVGSETREIQGGLPTNRMVSRV